MVLRLSLSPSPLHQWDRKWPVLNLQDMWVYSNLILCDRSWALINSNISLPKIRHLISTNTHFLQLVWYATTATETQSKNNILVQTSCDLANLKIIVVFKNIILLNIPASVPRHLPPPLTPNHLQHQCNAVLQLLRSRALRYRFQSKPRLKLFTCGM